MISKAWTSAVLLALAVLAAPVVRAEAPPADDWKQGRLVDIHTDKLSLKPYLTEEIWYSSNVYLNEDADEADFLFVTRPGVDLEYDNKDGGTLAKLGYNFRALNYLDLDDLDEYEHHASVSLDQKLGKFKLDAFFKYDQQKTIVDYQAFPIQGYDILGFGAKASYDFNVLDGEVGFERKGYTYDEDIYDEYDHDEDRVWVQGAYHAWDKTDVLLEFAWGQNSGYDPDAHNDSTYVEVLAGIKGRPSAKIGLQAKIGYRSENYDENPLIPYEDDYAGLIVRIAATWEASDRDRLNLGILREPVPSLSSNYYTTNRVTLDYAHAFDNRFRASAGLYFEISTESDDVDDYNRFGGQIGAGYDILAWLTLDGRFEYATKDGDFDAWDYDVMRFMLSVTGRF
jgi:hypothetical protein